MSGMRKVLVLSLVAAARQVFVGRPASPLQLRDFNDGATGDVRLTRRRTNFEAFKPF